jgi:hypothetical protein
MKTRIALFITAVLIACLTMTAYSFAQEIPKPGTVIDKNNYKTYAHLFPPEILPAFEDGFGGLTKPVSITVDEPKQTGVRFPKAFLALSAANKDKYSLDANGNIVGGWQRQGLPFPDLQRGDKDFVTKLMWNFAARYVADDLILQTYSYMQRRGEPVRRNKVENDWLYFTGRAVVSPTPNYKTSNNVSNTAGIFYKEPEAMKNMQTTALRFMDINKADEVYIYLPNLRRVLRGDSGQRSVPLQGNLAALDDLNLFDGKTNEFTYKLIGEQKVLTIQDEPVRPVSAKPLQTQTVPYPSAHYTLADVYVVDIVSKDAVYPQSRKRIWMEKNTLYIYYAVVWDRAGKLWKVWHVPTSPVTIPGDAGFVTSSSGFGVDVQFGMTNLVEFRLDKYNKGSLTWEDVSPAGMLKRAR